MPHRIRAPQTSTSSTRWSRIVSLASLPILALALTCTSIGCVAGRDERADWWQPPPDYQPVDRFDLIRGAADREALYTLAGGLKPMSSGFWQGSFEMEDPDLTELRDVRRALGHLRNRVWYADVQVFRKTHEGKRWAQGFVVHREALARMIERHQTFWNPWGVAPCTHPAEIVAIVDRMPRNDRWRGYGYLFGYPDEAVDFFVQAGMDAEDGREVGPGKDRQFLEIPTYRGESGMFTYAVPLDHVATKADREIAETAGRILDAYRQLRPGLDQLDDVMEGLLRLNAGFEPLTMVETTVDQRTDESPR